MREQREKSIQVGHILTKDGVSESVSNLSEEELKKSLETFEGVKSIDTPLEIRPPQEIEYSNPNPLRTSRPTLKRKVSWDQLSKEEPLKPAPQINTPSNSFTQSTPF